MKIVFYHKKDLFDFIPHMPVNSIAILKAKGKGIEFHVFRLSEESFRCPSNATYGVETYSMKTGENIGSSKDFSFATNAISYITDKLAA